MRAHWIEEESSGAQGSRGCSCFVGPIVSCICDLNLWPVLGAAEDAIVLLDPPYPVHVTWIYDSCLYKLEKLESNNDTELNFQNVLGIVQQTDTFAINKLERFIFATYREVVSQEEWGRWEVHHHQLASKRVSLSHNSAHRNTTFSHGTSPLCAPHNATSDEDVAPWHDGARAQRVEQTRARARPSARRQQQQRRGAKSSASVT